MITVWQQVGPPAPAPPADRSAGPAARGRKVCFSWRIENFLAFKEIMETRKIFSRCCICRPIIEFIAVDEIPLNGVHGCSEFQHLCTHCRAYAGTVQIELLSSGNIPTLCYYPV